MTAECTNIDHSDYKVATNHWGLERKERVEFCPKCKRPDFYTWYQRLLWSSKDPAYWKQVFKDATEQKVFFFKAVPNGKFDHPTYVYVDADTVNDPASVLRPTVPKRAQRGIVADIKQERYRRRLPQTKEHYYGPYQAGINAAMDAAFEDLEYVDNRRFAAADSRKDMRRYNAQKDHGCCGYYDATVTVMGRLFWIGCNYGH